MTAALLVAAGIGLLRRKPWSRSAFLLGAGTLLYTATVSPGYFAQRGQWPFVVMFGVTLTLTVVAVIFLAPSTSGRDESVRQRQE